MVEELPPRERESWFGVPSLPLGYCPNQSPSPQFRQSPNIIHSSSGSQQSLFKMWCRWPYKDGRSLRPLLPLYPSPAICQPCHVRERRAISEYQPREPHLIADLIPMIRRLQYGYNRAQRFRTEKISFGGSLHKHQKSKASTGHRPRNLMVWSAARAQPSHTSARTPLTPVHELTNEKRERC